MDDEKRRQHETKIMIKGNPMKSKRNETDGEREGRDGRALSWSAKWAKEEEGSNMSNTRHSGRTEVKWKQLEEIDRSAIRRGRRKDKMANESIGIERQLDE